MVDEPLHVVRAVPLPNGIYLSAARVLTTAADLGLHRVIVLIAPNKPSKYTDAHVITNSKTHTDTHSARDRLLAY
jgi:hypothetical protein